MKAKIIAACLAGAALVAPAVAQQPAPVAGAPRMETAPRLVVAISIEHDDATGTMRPFASRGRFVVMPKSLEWVSLPKEP